MKKLIKMNYFKYSFIAIAILGILSTGMIMIKKQPTDPPTKSVVNSTVEKNTKEAEANTSSKLSASASENLVPVYGNWKNFTTKNGLPSDKVYCVRVAGDKVYAGTHDGLAVYEKGNWKTYTTKDGLAHNGVVSVDVSELTGDVWVATLGGLSRWSAGKFENFTQFNSGMPNDLVYMVICAGKDIWCATGGGVGHYDTYTKEWEIFTEKNAPMHEPWTYGVSFGDNKIFIAAWGGGVIEYNTKTKQFRDYVDPDGFMEIDLLPDDGVVHDITTATSWSEGILWVSTYFGLSRYDGAKWKGYFDHDSGLASNFINFVRVEGKVAYSCTDRGLSATDGKTWVTYKRNEKNENGVAILTNGTEKKEIVQSPGIAHSFIIGVDADKDFLWVATSKGVSRGELIK